MLSYTKNLIRRLRKLDTTSLSSAAGMDLDLNDGLFEMEVSNNFFNFPVLSSYPKRRDRNAAG